MDDPEIELNQKASKFLNGKKERAQAILKYIGETDNPKKKVKS